MAIVSTLFVIGGNVEKMVCEPLANRQLFKVQKTSSLLFLNHLSSASRSEIMLHNGQHCGSVLMKMHVCIDHRHSIPGSSRQEELPSWYAVSES